MHDVDPGRGTAVEIRPIWNESMSDLYGKIKEDLEFRREWAEKCGISFKLASVVPNVPKTEQKEDAQKVA